MVTPKKYTSVRTVVPVEIDGRNYELRQASTNDIIEFRNSGMNAMRVSEGKAVGLNNFLDCEPALLAKCLFDVHDGVKPLSVTWIRAMDYHIYNDLWNTLREISGMDDEEAAAKNSQSATAELSA